MGSVAMIKMLISEFGADSNARSCKNDMPLHIAAMNGKEDVVFALIDKFGCDPTVKGDIGRSLLHNACHSGNVSLVKTLICDFKANITARDDDKNLPIHAAALSGKKELVLTLINQFGCDPTVKGQSGASLLHRASRSGNITLVQTLIRDFKFDITALDHFKNMPIHVAAFTGKEEVVLTLIKEFGCDPTAKGRFNRTPLHCACQSDNISLVQTLIRDFKSDISARDNSNNLPIHVAVWNRKDEDVVFAHVNLLLSNRTDIDSKGYKGRTVLIMASNNGYTRVADLVLGAGANIDSQDDEGNSALMIACKNGHVKTTSYLLDQDADTLLKSSDGKTAFDLAMHTECDNLKLRSLFTKLRRRPSCPGCLFLERVKKETITTKKKTIDLEEMGLTLLFPEGALPPTDPPLQLKIQPCFSGSFALPQDVELVSPAYFIKPNKKVSFQKEVLVKIWHHANLESEEDCKDMVFLSASTSPQYSGENPVYVFKEIEGAKGSFRPGEEHPVGEIALKHFCTLAIGKRKENEKTHSKG